MNRLVLEQRDAVQCTNEDLNSCQSPTELVLELIALSRPLGHPAHDGGLDSTPAISTDFAPIELKFSQDM